MKYTMTFDKAQHKLFIAALRRYDSDDEFTVIQGISPVADNDKKEFAIVDTCEEIAMVMRMSMNTLKCDYEKTEEEIAERKKLIDSKKISVTVFTG
jgi:hypothetical protein